MDAGSDPGAEDIPATAGAIFDAALAILQKTMPGHVGFLVSIHARTRLQALLTAWSGASAMSEKQFTRTFFGLFGKPDVAQALREAAIEAATARDGRDIERAGQGLAAVLDRVRPGHWGRFLADAERRVEAAASPASDPSVIKVASGPEPADALGLQSPGEPDVAVAKEPEHGAVWRWLHRRGLVKTWHEKADDLRRAWGSQSGQIFFKDGVPVDIDGMSDDELRAFEQDTRSQRAYTPTFPPLLGPVGRKRMTSWGWSDSKPYKDARNELMQPGTHDMLNGKVPNRSEALEMLIEEGVKPHDIRIDPKGHPPEGDSTHHAPHINYNIREADEFGNRTGVIVDKGMVYIRP